MNQPTNKKKEEWIDKVEAKIMDWFYECVKINFNVTMIQDSTELREILERNYPSDIK